MKVGDKIWRFDQNRRRYPPKKPGEVYSSGCPIYREHWVQTEITAENRVSWFAHAFRCPKRGPHPGFAFTEQEIDDDCWVNEHVRRISAAVLCVCDAGTLRKIAALIGWEPKS